MKITGFKILKGGLGGIKVEGIDLVESGNARAMFKDTVSRERKFPLSLQLRNAVDVLNYPFLVGTEHWRSEFAEQMKEDFSMPDRKNGNPAEHVFKTLTSFWDSTQITQCSVEKGNYKITGEITCEMCVIKAVVNVVPDNEYSLYSFVETAIMEIVRLVEQTLGVPQLALGTENQIREIFNEISSKEDQELVSDMNADEAFLMLMRTANKKGYGIVLDDNMLAELASATDNDSEGEQLDDPFEILTDIVLVEQETEPQPEPEETVDMNVDMSVDMEMDQVVKNATVKSKKTKDKGIFKDSEPEFTPDPEPEFIADPDSGLI